jgi:hypothetical protein
VELLAVAPRDAPVFVVLDDLHWADHASLQLLRHSMVSTTPMDVTIACTYRDTDLSRGDPLTKLLSDLHRQANVTRIALAGLESDELVELMAAAAGHDLDDTGIGLAHALRRETDGNPFFAVEILRHLGETGGIALGHDGRWTVDRNLEELGLPSSVRDVIGRRVERLGDEALRVLRLASVIGREFDVDQLASLAEMDEDALLDLLDAAVAAAVVGETNTVDRYRFAHALIQHSLYDELSPSRRQRAHQHVAERLEASGAPDEPAKVAELAHHWIAATRPADIDKALRYARRAGDVAREALAPDDAIRWYRQALDLLDRHTPPDDHQRAGVLASLGTVQRESGDPAHEDTLVEAASIAERIDDIDSLVAAALGFEVAGGQAIANSNAARVIDAALERIGTEPTTTRAKLLAQLAPTYGLTADMPIRRRLALEALDIARSTDDATFAYVVYTTQQILGTPDRVEQQIADIERAVAIADRNGDPALRFATRVPMLWAQYQRADIARADTVLAEMQHLTETIGLPSHRWQLAQCQVGRWRLAGRTSDAEAANDSSLELGTAAGEPATLASYGGLLLGIRQHQGRLDEFIDLLIDTVRENPSVPELRSAIPNMLCDVDRIDEARERFAIEAASDFDYPYHTTWLAGMVNVTDAAATLRHHDACSTLIERLTPYVDHVVAAGATTVTGALARPLARAATVIEHYDDAEQWFATAHDLHTRLQAPFWLAKGQLDHADLCIARHDQGDVEQARELITVAGTTATEYGCAGLVKRANALLATI